MSASPATEPDCRKTSARAVEWIVRAGSRGVGEFAVRRALPAREKRAVGPFVFWDHMGPAALEPGHGLDVRPHPHINLATITYLFEGEILHKDSLGSDQAIVPGEINWMTAGRGIVHSERSGARARREGARIHGIQSWIALPSDVEEVEPSFHHHTAEALPNVSLPGARLRVLVGAAYAVASPVRTFSPMFYVEARTDAGAELAFPADYEERAAYVVRGSVACEGQRAEPGELIVLRPETAATLHALTEAHVMLLGGAPLDGPRHVWWNFVSSSRERIERAKRDWKDGRFPKVPGDETEFIPLPE